MNVDLKRLRHLMALADERHFSRAASTVNLSQSAFSRSIQALEDEVGMALVDRESSDVDLTPAGSFLVERARVLLFDANALGHDLLQYRQGSLGRLAFGTGPFAGASLIPDLVAEFRRLEPRVSLRIEVNNWQRLYQRLLAEDLEFFVADVRDVPGDRRIQISALGQQPGGFYVRRGHPLSGERCTIEDILGYGILSVSLPAVTKQALAAFVPEGIDPAQVVALECDDFNLLKSVALSSDSVLTATQMALAEELADGSLVALLPEGFPGGFSRLGIVTLSKRQNSPLAKRFMNAIRERLGEASAH
jgi:DNA-binding transcriptional LysR family regulator